MGAFGLILASFDAAAKGLYHRRMFWRAFYVTLALIGCLVLGGEGQALHEESEQVRAYTRAIEFDYVDWTIKAAALKVEQTALGEDRYLSEAAGGQLVLDYMNLVWQIQQAEAELANLHADPHPESVAAQIEALDAHLGRLVAQRDETAPLAESILQAQVSAVIEEEGLAVGGQPVPPVLFHSTPLPWALIVSPRDEIRQEANLSLETELTLEEHIALEDEVAAALDVSTLVVPVGGIGTYPTMVAQSSDLNWLMETISHEWTHNYLTLHPLGLLYDQSQELRTLNETTANITGKEIGAAVIRRFYPSLVPAPPPPPAPADEGQSSAPPPAEPETPVFDFRAEMHATRVQVDALLAEGKVVEAEQYMEARRLFFWDNGYPIRKLNQAYFAFHGSYADSPIGPAGEDPVGAAVRQLRARSGTLAEFVHRMAYITSFEELQAYLANAN
jgi:hypothetical protein